MRRLTDDTGGRTFRVDRRNSLTEIYNQLQEDCAASTSSPIRPPIGPGRPFPEDRNPGQESQGTEGASAQSYYALAPGAE